MSTTEPDVYRAEGVRWDLGDLYSGPTDPRIEEDLRRADEDAERFARTWRGRIETGELSPQELRTALEEFEGIVERAGRPGFYAALLFAADTRNEAAQTLEERARERSTEIANRLVFFELEIQKIPAESYEKLRDDPEVAPWRHYLDRERRLRPHSLTEPEEKVLNRKDLSGPAAWMQLFDELTSSWSWELEIDGERKTLTEEEILSLLRHPKRDIRRRALETFLATFRDHSIPLVSIFNALLLDHRLDVELREYPSLIAPRHLANDVDQETVEAMMDATDRHYPDIQEYLRLKAQLLGIDDMAISDVYAPLVTDPERIPFDQAREMVLDAFGDFSETFAELAREFFDRRWIDAEVRGGKRGGAFCAALSPNHHPYVLSSYTGTSRDVSTIAHELGHGIHDQLSRKQRFLSYGAPLVLCETASVFSEMVLTDRLLRNAPSEKVRLQILCDTLDEIYGTVFRQNAMTRFELAAHERRRSERLGAETLGELWLDAQSRLFGNALTIPEIYRWGWSYIPHFVHSPFYCYSYSFGELLVLALYERYREEGPSFVPRYLGLLESGGSDSPRRLLERLGMDLSDPGFWDTGFRAIRRLLDELREAVPAARITG